MKKEVAFVLNGKSKQFTVDVRKSLAEVLREQAGMLSIKIGCGVGECGACSVIVDDVVIDSCIFLAVWADGKSIRTVEGFSKDGEMSLVQKAYVDEGAIQCGFCTAGFVVKSTNFVEKNRGKQISRGKIRKEHAGNICRCTGYNSIVDAVEKCCKSGKE